MLDIGPETIRTFEATLEGARSAIWNGPLGIFEREPFDRGTNAIARAVAALEGQTVVGGGETAAAVRRLGLDEQIWHVSTGGGAALAFLSGRTLPGLEPLRIEAAETAATGG